MCPITLQKLRFYHHHKRMTSNFIQGRGRLSPRVGHNILDTRFQHFLIENCHFSLVTSIPSRKKDKKRRALCSCSCPSLSCLSIVRLCFMHQQVNQSCLVHVQFICFDTIRLTSFYTTRNRPLRLLCAVKDFCTFRLDCIKSLKSDHVSMQKTDGVSSPFHKSYAGLNEAS